MCLSISENMHFQAVSDLSEMLNALSEIKSNQIKMHQMK